MPYITKGRREAIWNESLTDRDSHVGTAGELNYFLTGVLTEYIQHKGECYQTYNDIIGALEGAKMEMYRRKIVPYEDKKLKTNGDVY